MKRDQNTSHNIDVKDLYIRKSDTLVGGSESC